MPRKEVVSLIGSKEGIGNMAVAYVDPGDIVLVASPCYPVYHIGTAFSAGRNYFLPLKKENQFLPDLRFHPRQTSPSRRNSFGSTIPIIRLRRSPTGISIKELSISPPRTTSSSATMLRTRKWVSTDIGR